LHSGSLKFANRTSNEFHGIANLPLLPPDSEDRPSRWLDGSRLWRRLGELARLGATPEGGVNRPALSVAEAAARRSVIGWASEFGAHAFSDPAGNLFLKLEGSERTLPPVLTGSYLDSQPDGGKYSGAYGMLAALESLAAIAALGRRPKRSLIAAAWMNGEGSRFAPGYMGSEAFAGLRQLAGLLTVSDFEGKSVGEELTAMLTAQGPLPAKPLGFACAAYVETHLEQGAKLEKDGTQIGVVTGVQGVRRFQIRVDGQAAHIGTTSRQSRRDALHATIKIIGALEQFFAAPDVGFAVSQLRVEPNAPSIVPRATHFTVDIRHRDNTVLMRLGDTIRLICESEKGVCRFAMTELVSTPAIDFDPDVQAHIERAADRLALSHTPILSLGGHDAQSLKWLCPSGIIFIPCRDGATHSPDEQIEPGQAAAGAKVLADVLWELANL